MPPPVPPGMDAVAAVDRDLVLAPGACAAVPTGLKLAIPDGYELQVRPRSGLALRHGLTVANAPGTIDSDYRGELQVLLANLGRERRDDHPRHAHRPAGRRAGGARAVGGGRRGSPRHRARHGRLRLDRGVRDDQLDRYARHIVLKEVGGAGQAKLLNANVAVVGAGGLGSPCLLYLAAAGVGRITVIDDDTVALSNLQRQVLHGTADVGRAKTASAIAGIARINPDVVVTPQAVRLDAANAASLIAGHDVVADGSDSFATRLAVADAALRLRIPLVSAAVGPFEGQLATFRGWEAGGPCYRCFVGSAPGRDDTSCADQGILGAVAGVLGSLQALEVIRAITGFGRDPAGTLLLVDALALRMRTLALAKDPACPACG